MQRSRDRQLSELFFFFFAPMNSPNESSLRVNRELNDVERDRGNATFLNEIFSLAKTRPFLPPLFTEIERERERDIERKRERDTRTIRYERVARGGSNRNFVITIA